MTNRPSKPDGAAGVAADRYADAAHLRAVALAGVHFSLIPLELLGAAVERFLDERAGRILLLAGHERSERRFALRGIHAPDGHLIDAELSRGFREDRLHDRDSLHAAGRTLRSCAAACWSGPSRRASASLAAGKERRRCVPTRTHRPPCRTGRCRRSRTCRGP